MAVSIEPLAPPRGSRSRDRWAPRVVAGRTAVIATAVALAVRLFRLNFQSLWLDEVLTYLNSQTSLHQLVVDPVVDPNIPPLYYVLIHWVLLLGRDEVALRLPSVVAGVLTVPLVFALGRRWLGAAAGAAAAVLLAISPFHVWYSQEARPYALLLLLGVAAMWLLERLRDDPTRRGERVAFVLVAAATFYCHTVAIPLLVVLAGYAGLTADPGRRREWLVTFAAVGLVAAPALLRLLLIPPTVSANSQYRFDPAHVGYTFWAFGTGFSLGPNLIELRTQGVASLREHGLLIGAASAVLAVVLFAGARRLRTAPAAVRGVLAAWLFFPVAFAVLGTLITKHPYNVRYAILAFPPFVLCLAAGLTGFRARTARIAAAAALVTVSALSLANYFSDPSYQREDNRGAARFLQAHARPGDLVIVSAGYTAVPLRHYPLPAGLDLVPYPARRAEDRPSLGAAFVRGDRVADDLETLVGGREAFWVFLSRTFHSDPEGRIERYLDGHYRRDLVFDGAGVELIRYGRALHGAAR